MKISKRLISAAISLGLLVSTFAITVNAAEGSDNEKLRSGASISSTVVNSASKGDAAAAITLAGDWYKVFSGVRPDCTNADFMNLVSTADVTAGSGVVSGTADQTSVTAKSVAQATGTSETQIIGINTGWYKVICGENVCYIRSDYLDLAALTSEAMDSTVSSLVFRGGKSTAAAEVKAAQKITMIEEDEEIMVEEVVPTLGEMIVGMAENCLGIPYVWGGTTTRGFDCSGLVYYVLTNLGYSPARGATGQFGMGYSVSKANLEPGDLVFFAGTYKSGISHVGIYVGDGMFIHAPNSGEVVRYDDLTSGYYANHYYGARRMG